MPVEIETDGRDAGGGQPFGQGRHRIVVLAGENAVHQDDHRATAGLRVEAVRKCNDRRQGALGTADLHISSRGARQG